MRTPYDPSDDPLTVDPPPPTLPSASLVSDDTEPSSSNRRFYDNMEVPYLHDVAVRTGLDHGHDIDLLWPDIASATSILEIGAGGGRVLDALLARGYAGRLVAIERSAHFAEVVRRRLADRVEVLTGAVPRVAPSRKVDVALWLWSGIAEIPRPRQASVVQTVLSWIADGGLLVLEAPEPGSTTNATESDDQVAVVVASFGTLRVYHPSEDEIRQLAAGLAEVTTVRYVTPTGRKRVLFKLRKQVSKIAP